MEAVASATTSSACGAFSAYEVVRLPGRVEMSSDDEWSTGQVSPRVIERVDGRLVDTAAVSCLVSADTTPRAPSARSIHRGRRRAGVPTRRRGILPGRGGRAS